MAAHTTTTTSKQKNQKKRKMAFVTVGTTRFDALVQVMTTPAALTTLASHNFTHLVLQIGASPEPPMTPAVQGEEDEEEKGRSRSGGLRRRRPTTGSSKAGGGSGGDGAAAIDVSWYPYKDTLRADMEAADLIISHAGAGSIMEALDLGKTLLVVVNTALMDDHQQELARAMEEQGYLVATETPDVLDSLRTYDEWHNRLIPRPSPTLGLLPALLDQEMGFVSLQSSTLQESEGSNPSQRKAGGNKSRLLLRRRGGV